MTPYLTGNHHRRPLGDVWSGDGRRPKQERDEVEPVGVEEQCKPAQNKDGQQIHAERRAPDSIEELALANVRSRATTHIPKMAAPARTPPCRLTHTPKTKGTIHTNRWRPFSAEWIARRRKRKPR